MRVLLLQVGDTHFGSRVAVCPPSVELEDGGTYQANGVQRWLWDRWVECARAVGEIHDDWGAERFHVVHMGDIIDGAKHASWQRIGPNTSEQKGAARRGLDVFFGELPDMTSLRFIRGTPAHAGQAHGHEESVAKHFVNERLPVVPLDDRRACHYRAQFVTETGHRVDALHHDTVNGRRPWTRHASAARLAEVIWNTYARNGQPAPDVAMRGHTHFFKDSGLSAPLRAVVSPGWQMKYDWVEQVAPEEWPAVGAVVWKLETGKRPVIEPLLYQPATREDPWRTSASPTS